MEIMSFAIYSLGVIAAMGFVAYWCFALRMVLDKEPNAKIQVLFLIMLIAFPPITPSVIYLLYLDFFKKRHPQSAFAEGTGNTVNNNRSSKPIQPQS